MTSPEAGADLSQMIFSFFYVLQRKQPWNVADYAPHSDMVYIKLVDLHGHWRETCRWRQLCCNHRLKLHSRVCLLWESFQYVFVMCSVFAADGAAAVLNEDSAERAESIAWDVLFVFFSGAFGFSLHQSTPHWAMHFFFFKCWEKQCVCIRERKLWRLWRKKAWSQNKALKICANPYQCTQRPTEIVMIIKHLNCRLG